MEILVFTRNGRQEDMVVTGPSDEIVLDLILAEDRLMVYTESGLYLSEPILASRKNITAPHQDSTLNSTEVASRKMRERTSPYKEFTYIVSLAEITNRSLLINDQFVEIGNRFEIEGNRFRLQKIHKSAIYVQNRAGDIYRIKR